MKAAMNEVIKDMLVSRQPQDRATLRKILHQRDSDAPTVFTRNNVEYAATIVSVREKLAAAE